MSVCDMPMRQRRQSYVMRPFLYVLFATAVLSAGCQATGVGDPCTPENIPEGGFDGAESYLETSSVQCRTRVCLVYELAGDPTHTPDLTGCTPGTADCVGDQEVTDRVYCTCRCAVPEGGNANTPLCSCADGFTCQSILELGGAGIQGSYCVKSDTIVN